MRALVLLLAFGCTDRPIATPPTCLYAADPTCVPERCEPVAPARTTLGTEVGYLHAAWNGDGYGLVWYGLYTGAFFARADASGAIIDMQQISTVGLFPRVAWNGEHYGIAMADGAAARNLVFLRLDRDGNEVSRRVVTAGSDSLQNPIIVWNRRDREWGVLYEDLDAAHNVTFVQLDADGATLRETTLGDPGAQFGGGGNALIWTEEGYAIAWGERDAVYVKTPAATLSRSAQYPYRPAITFDGDAYGITWMEANDLSFETHFVRSNALDQRITWSAPNTHFGEPNVIWDGDAYLVVGDRGSPTELWQDRVRKDGTREGIAKMTAGIFPYLLWNGCQPAVTFVDASAGHLLVMP